jgi:hypothetical protein
MPTLSIYHGEVLRFMTPVFTDFKSTEPCDGVAAIMQAIASRTLRAKRPSSGSSACCPGTASERVQDAPAVGKSRRGSPCPTVRRLLRTCD